MRMRWFCCVAVVGALFAYGCSQESSPPPKPSEPVAKIREGASEVAQGAAKVAEGLGESAGQAAEKVTETAVAAKDEALAEAKQVAENTEAAASQVASAVSDSAQQVKQDLDATVDVPGTITYEASKGTVTFHHAEHAKRLACRDCHATDPPEKIVFGGMAEAHALCRDCHKQKGGAAPTACSGCHKS